MPLAAPRILRPTRTTRPRASAPVLLGLAVARSYTVTPPDPTGANAGAASGSFTVSIPASTTLPGTVHVTPAATGVTFTPTSVALHGDNASATFTATGAASGNKAVTFTNDGGLANAAALTLVILPSATYAAAFDVRLNVDRGDGVLGTYDPITGNYTDPGIANVLATHTYKFAGSTLTGTATGGTTIEYINASTVINPR